MLLQRHHAKSKGEWADVIRQEPGYDPVQFLCETVDSRDAFFLCPDLVAAGCDPKVKSYSFRGEMQLG